jgi:hypothetical protein
VTDIAFPTLTRAAPPELAWEIVWNTGEFTAPLSGETQTFENPGGRWRCSLMFPNLQEADAGLLQAWLVKLKGKANRALLHNFARPNIRGTMTGTPQVNGADQTGSSLLIELGGNAKTLLSGDFIGFGGRLKMVLDDMVTDGAGIGTVNIGPPIYPGEAPANDAPITLVKPTCRMLLEDDRAAWLTRNPVVSDIPLAFIEAIA